MADVGKIVKEITSEEKKMLKPMKQRQRIDWIIKRWGSGPEKKERAVSGRAPSWAHAACNEIDWKK